ncbi:MAG: zinc ABC transporter substrate-binding protein [Treponema sp.]|nr:zinc ABC transporter substrate-binding protein [Treponema sp.]
MIIVIIVSVSCARQAQQEGILIAVSIPPQSWFVSQIAGDNTRTMILAGSGQNPHNYEPTPRQIKALSGASAWILSGAEFEISLFPKVISLFPDLLIIDGTEGVKFRFMEDHDHDGNTRLSIEIDRHTWLGREPAKILAGHIKDTLSLLDSSNESYYQERYENLIIEIDNEFDNLSVMLAPLNGKSVFVYHPSFGYFLDEFGIYQEAVETGGKEPGPRVLNDLIIKIKEEQALGQWSGVIFVQTQFPVYAARNLAAAVDAELISLDPLAENWLENIRLMGSALMKAAP